MCGSILCICTRVAFRQVSPSNGTLGCLFPALSGMAPQGHAWSSLSATPTDAAESPRGWHPCIIPSFWQGLRGGGVIRWQVSVTLTDFGGHRATIPVIGLDETGVSGSGCQPTTLHRCKRTHPPPQQMGWLSPRISQPPLSPGCVVAFANPLFTQLPRANAISLPVF